MWFFDWVVDGDIVALSKHLCGNATDLTLRCVTKSSLTNNVQTTVEGGGDDDNNDKSSQQTTTTTTTKTISKQPVAILIALCCHHRCKWSDYISMWPQFSLFVY